MKSLLIKIGFGLGAGVLLLLGVLAWRSYVMDRQEERSYAKAQTLVQDAEYDAALAIIRRHRQVPTGDEAERVHNRRWVALELDALAGAGHNARLFWYYERKPDLFLEHEAAALLVGRVLLQMRNKTGLTELRRGWQGREGDVAGWLALDVDRALAEGRKEDALAMLQAHAFSGKADCGRLARLALLHAHDLPKAWDYLDQAAKADPKNPEVRSFRGQILEAAGKERAARVEYVAAHLAEPKNPLFRDQLGEFYRRKGNYALAQQTWTEGDTLPPFSFLWLKSWFWNRMVLAKPLRWEDLERPEDGLRPFLDYVLGLPEDRYWDEKAFEQVAGAHQLEQERQEVFWLRLVQLLKDGHEEKALAMLRLNAFRHQSWHADIEAALVQVLSYRRSRHFDGSSRYVSAPGKHHHTFFHVLNKVIHQKPDVRQVPPEIERLVLSDAVFAAVFLAGGWREAALFLHPSSPSPPGFPDWVAYGVTQALRFNRGVDRALAFAQKQAPSPSLRLLEGELLLSKGQTDGARAVFEPLAQQASGVGYRAAWLLSLMRLDQKDAAGARAYVEGNALLSQSPAGREVLARAALLSGDEARAEQVYESLQPVSLEARSYLARQAFRAKNWPRARQLTREMLADYPDNMQLRTNLKRIEQHAENAGGDD